MKTKQQQLEQALAHAHPETLAIRTGIERSAQREHAEPIFATSSYVFNTAAEAAALFMHGQTDDDDDTQPANVYSRYTNPTVRLFEQRLAALEGAEAAVATSSGMAAILSTCMALLGSGDHILCSRSVFGATTVLLNQYMAKFGVEVSYVSPTDMKQWQQAIQPNTKLFFVETPSNPLSEIVDIHALAELADNCNSLLVVDNCFCTPALQQPLRWGADIVIHSATKYIDGQGRCLGGAVVGTAEQMDKVRGFLRTCGPSMSPFNAWVFAKGLETLQLRMMAHSHNALALAQWLQEQSGIKKVYYAGLLEHPQHELAAKQQSAFGGVLAFTVKGDREAAWRFNRRDGVMFANCQSGRCQNHDYSPRNHDAWSFNR